MIAQSRSPQNCPNILHIEDNESDRMVFKVILNRLCPAGKLLSEANPLRAMEKLQDGSYQPELMFVDINLPEMYGPQFVSIARKLKGFANVPVFMISSSTSEQDWSAALRAGASGVVEKVLDVDEMTRSVERAVRSTFSGLSAK